MLTVEEWEDGWWGGVDPENVENVIIGVVKVLGKGIGEDRGWEGLGEAGRKEFRSSWEKVHDGSVLVVSGRVGAGDSGELVTVDQR